MIDKMFDNPKIAICITVEEKTLKKIDSVRGMIPRSAFIQNILKNNLKRDGC